MKNQRKYIDGQLNDILFSEFKIKNSDFILRIFQELMLGSSISKNRFYKLIKVSKDKADAILNKLGETDVQGNIIAFSGLSTVPTKHRFIVNGKMLYTWCVVDAILFAEWLGVEANVHSTDPFDNSPIELQINGGQLLWTTPYPLFISWLESVDTCNIKGSLCNHVSFFASERTAKQWLKNNPDGKILTLEDFFEPKNIGMKCC